MFTLTDLMCSELQVNFSDDALIQNISAFVGALLGAKPVGLKKSERLMFFL